MIGTQGMRAASGRALCAMAAALMLAAPTLAQDGAAPAGAMQEITVHGDSLEGNLAGDPADRTVFVYLPPGYTAEPERRYPVVYFLHGYYATASAYVDLLGGARRSTRPSRTARTG